MNSSALYPDISDRKVILASQSPRRKQLLEWAEVPFEVVVVPTEETYPPGMAIEDVPVHIAKQKALAVQNTGNYAGALIIAADTIVVAGNDIIGKPVSHEHAVRILTSLSGQTHQVITGVCILGKEEVTFSDITSVAFHPLDQQEIEFYIQKYKPFDKAGAYGIQEWIGVTGIRAIHGDFYNVMGLPVSRVIQALKSGKV